MAGTDKKSKSSSCSFKQKANVVFEYEFWIHHTETNVFFAFLQVGIENCNPSTLGGLGRGMKLWKSFNKTGINKMLYSHIGYCNLLESDVTKFQIISKSNEHIYDSLIFLIRK